MLADYAQALPAHDAVLFSDYGKGGLTHIPRMIELARGRQTGAGRPQGSDYSRYAGATVVTPNRAELAQVVGRAWRDEADLHRTRASAARASWPDGLVLTRSEDGMSCSREDGGVPPDDFHVPPRRARSSTSPAPATPSSRRWPRCSPAG